MFADLFRALPLLGDDAAVFHGTAFVGVQQRFELIDELVHVLAGQRGQPPRAGAPDAPHADFPGPRDARGKVADGSDFQSRVGQPFGVVGNGSQGRTQKGITDRFDLFNIVWTLGRVASQPDAEGGPTSGLNPPGGTTKKGGLVK